jgi:hypothetical protein
VYPRWLFSLKHPITYAKDRRFYKKEKPSPSKRRWLFILVMHVTKSSKDRKEFSSNNPQIPAEKSDNRCDCSNYFPNGGKDFIFHEE